MIKASFLTTNFVGMAFLGTVGIANGDSGGERPVWATVGLFASVKREGLMK